MTSGILDVAGEAAFAARVTPRALPTRRLKALLCAVRIPGGDKSGNKRARIALASHWQVMDLLL